MRDPSVCFSSPCGRDGFAGRRNVTDDVDDFRRIGASSSALPETFSVCDSPTAKDTFGSASLSGDVPSLDGWVLPPSLSPGK